MSVGAIGSQPYLSQTLSNLLAQLTPGTAAFSAGVTPSSDTQSTQPTGPSTPQLSAQILNVLLMIQEDSGTQGGNTPASANPLQQLFAAMDTDGDGTVSQSEMESYIGQQGGTEAQADALFNGLNQSGSGNLTENQLAGDLQQVRGHFGAHHHHHHHMPMADSDATATDTGSSTQTTPQPDASQSALDSLLNGLAQSAGAAGELLAQTA